MQRVGARVAFRASLPISWENRDHSARSAWGYRVGFALSLHSQYSTFSQSTQWEVSRRASLRDLLAYGLQWLNTEKKTKPIKRRGRRGFAEYRRGNTSVLSDPSRNLSVLCVNCFCFFCGALDGLAEFFLDRIEPLENLTELRSI
jgi:hypothetical protein